MKRATRALLSQEATRRILRWLLVGAASLATLTPIVPHESGREICLRAAGLLLLLAAAALLYYGIRFGRVFLAFLFRRLCLMALMLLGITLVSFLIVRLAPGDPYNALSGADGGAETAIGRLNERDIRRSRDELFGSQAVHIYSAYANDPDGDRVRLEFDWGDESLVGKPDPVASNTVVKEPHSWWQAGNYEIRVRAIDAHGATSGWSPPLRAAARQGSELPRTPRRPKGLDRATAGANEQYTVAPGDTGEDVVIVIDWGDGTPVQATRKRPGGTHGLSKTWRAGIFQVRARAVGARGELSDWSEPLEVVAFEEGLTVVRPLLSTNREHATLRDTLSFTARAVSSRASELVYTLRVRKDGVPAARPVVGEPESAPSGASVELSHTFARAGRYVVEASVTERGRDGAKLVSEPLEVTIHETNRPPLTPARPTGPVDARIETTLVEQYFRWLTNVALLDFGRSHQWRREVWPLIWEERLPKTIILSALSLVLAYLIAIPIGVYSATHRHSLMDRFLGVTLFTLYSLPSFWVATMLIALAVDFPRLPIRGLWCGNAANHPAGVELHVPLLGLCLAGVGAVLAGRLARRSRFGRGPSSAVALLAGITLAAISLRMPGSALFRGLLVAGISIGVVLLVLSRPGRGALTWRTIRTALGIAALSLFALYFVGRLLSFDLFWHALMPVACLTYGGLAALSRYARSGMLDVVRQDYIRTARAKGLPERTVIFKHALRNGLIPVVTLFATILPQLISGSVIIESIFTIDGMGRLLVESVEDRDYNVIMAVTTLTAIMTMLGLLLSDVLYVVVDPRISLEKRISA